MSKTKEEVIANLGNYRKFLLKDHAFGDMEIEIETPNGDSVGDGYVGGGRASLEIEGVGFSGSEVQQILKKIPLGGVERNDSTGPDEFELGKTMPGLTLEGVHKELTGK